MKVGDYVRTKYGIRKIVEIEKDECYKPRVKVLVFDRYIEEVRYFGYKFYTDEKIIKEAKHSPNILDLIEVGDYVNGYKVLFIDNDLSKTKNIKCIDNEEERQCFYEQDIKSIVTKEQFESMQYEVK